jgi:hypothetical protein
VELMAGESFDRHKQVERPTMREDGERHPGRADDRQADHRDEGLLPPPGPGGGSRPSTGSGPTTQTRAGRLADASVDPTEARNARASDAMGHFLRVPRQVVLLAADRPGT